MKALGALPRWPPEEVDGEALLVIEDAADLDRSWPRLLETRRHFSEVQERLDTLQGSVANAVQRHELQELDLPVQPEAVGSRRRRAGVASSSMCAIRTTTDQP